MEWFEVPATVEIVGCHSTLHWWDEHCNSRKPSDGRLDFLSILVKSFGNIKHSEYVGDVQKQR